MSCSGLSGGSGIRPCDQRGNAGQGAKSPARLSRIACRAMQAHRWPNRFTGRACAADASSCRHSSCDRRQRRPWQCRPACRRSEFDQRRRDQRCISELCAHIRGCARATALHRRAGSSRHDPVCRADTHGGRQAQAPAAGFCSRRNSGAIRGLRPLSPMHGCSPEIRRRQRCPRPRRARSARLPGSAWRQVP